MAPSKRTKNSVRRTSINDDVSPEKDFMNLNKGKQRKRKLSNKLGLQWNKEELECFYEAFRRYGKDWRKVSAVVPNRSSDMVEALYNMNRAYLSLPEGTASVVGLVAMMTDHYNVLEGSVSEEESNDETSLQQKSQKGGRVKFRIRISNDDFGPSVASNDGCLSLLKRRQSDGRAVGKRTPRFPVSFPYRKGDVGNFALPSHKFCKPGPNVSSDEVVHVAALALAEASHRGGSPQSSHNMPYRKTGLSKPIVFQKMDPKSSKWRAGMLNLSPSLASDHILDGSKGYKDVENVNFSRCGSPSMYAESVGTVEVHKKGKKICKKKESYEDAGDIMFDDGREACSGTEEGVNAGSVKGKVAFEVSDLKKFRSPPCQRKRSKKLFTDENPAFDALQALADLSLMMPGSTSESAGKISAPESMSASQQGDKSELTKNGSLLPNSTVEFTTPGKSRPGMQLEAGACDPSEEKTQPMSASRSVKRKRKLLSPKVPGSEVKEESAVLSQEGKKVKVLPPEDFQHFSSMQNFPHASPESGSTRQALEVNGMQAAEECKRNSIFTKQVRTFRSPDNSLVICAGEHGISTDFTAHVPVSGDNELRTRRRCRQRKTQHQASTAMDNVKMIPSCLVSPLLRRWCVFEWFYSAVDYPWFSKNEFVDYLNHAGLGHIRSLTRVEWGVIRSSLGKPRRFSERFLKEEKEKLKQYRESVRTHYSELRTGIRDGLPADLARPLAVGQRIIALHPKTREVHEGGILTIDHDRCRVQFDLPEMGVEFVMDIDCMPLNPLENIPEILRRQPTCIERVSTKSRDPKPDPRSTTERSATPSSAKKRQVLCTYPDSLIPKHASSGTFEMAEKAQMPGDMVQPAAQSLRTSADTINPQQVGYARLPYPKREDDTQALFHLARALEKKEAVLMELKRTNDEVQEGRSNGESSASALRKHYATVLVQLKEASDQVSSAVLQLRLRNTYPGAILPLWMRQQASGGANNVQVNGLEPASDVVDIIKGSRSKARLMVDAAIKAIAAIKEGEDAFVVIDDALSSLDHWQSSSAPKSPLLPNNGGPAAPKSPDPSHDGHASIPANLITSCVAAFLMLQMCTERQYAPADVAQVLDKVVVGMQPISPQNVSVYREIEMCMGKIKTQILALVPT